MQICVIVDKPHFTDLPLIQEMVQVLSATHQVQLIDIGNFADIQTFKQAAINSQADIYLLKSHSARSLECAYFLEQQGALVINSWASTRACQDRVMMTQLMGNARFPWPRTLRFLTLNHLLADTALLAMLPFPLMVKSWHNYDGALVEKVGSIEYLQTLALQWSQEPVIIQEWIAGDGWDWQVRVIGDQVFAARRRASLDNQSEDELQLATRQVGEDIERLSLAIGRLFGLQIYDVDFILSRQGPVAIDINSFPDFRNLAGSEKALKDLVERIESMIAPTEKRLAIVARW